MAVWHIIEATKPHIAYAVVGVFSAIFSLVSLFIKQRLYIGESTLAGIYGLIVGPHCLKWFSPTTWGNTDSITLEITRIVLCLQIFAVAVELPRKYMLKHWVSVAMLLLPVMTAGWLIIGLFVWIIIPGLNFPSGLLISACITATDPILAQSVISGKFAQRVPGHLRNLLAAESGCNDGMAFPFIFLSLNLILYPGNGREIVKNWFCITLLYECIFGCVFGVFIGYTGRRAIKFAKEKNLIDRESFLSFYIFLSFCCAGFGSIIGVDDLLVSFAAGTAFAWDGWFSEVTEETKISTVIELLLNYSYFIYFGAIVPWEQFNNSEIGTDVWRLIILAIIVIFLRRIPAVLALKHFIPDIKSWREALFVGHFGPIGVGAVFAAILSRAELESSVSHEETPLAELPPKGTPHWQLMACVWPITCFFIVTSILVHGSSVAVITLSRHLNTITLSKSFSTHTTFGGTKPSWMARLPTLDKSGRSFSLQRVDTMGSASNQATPGDMSRTSTIETSGVPVRRAGGMTRRKKYKHNKARRKLKKRREQLLGIYGVNEFNDDELNDLGRERLQLEKEAQAGTFALGGAKPIASKQSIDLSAITTESHEFDETPSSDKSDEVSHKLDATSASLSPNIQEKLYNDEFGDNLENIQSRPMVDMDDEIYEGASHISSEQERRDKLFEMESIPKVAYAEGDNIIVENRQGEILDEINLRRGPNDEEASVFSGNDSLVRVLSNDTVQSFRALKNVLSPISSRDTSHNSHKPKYHAYKVGSTIIIENEEGEVLRRYRIRTHSEVPNDKKKEIENQKEVAGSSGVFSRTLSKLGLRSRASSSAQPPSPRDIENAQKMVRHLTPAPKRVKISESPDEISDNDEHSLSETDDEEIEEEEIISTTSIDSSIQDYVPQELHNYDRTLHDVIDNESMDGANINDDYSSGEESETSVERRRRLAALGQLSGPRPDDDEET
ncbi:hypothetical protein Kpol_1036p80 [Vanderwaltozyma polyspora DSM 70294]|uniref:Na(+)/H(+) antiporter n=1 Tax=Vanderwaltozyma polyspora (strain ATCC 22028 / DSM 70294 / BCRC 21397 / CBS 2163 / NBRC 10782 / NRRL Y-8283 / UCD 57-17) TaxID=436907 RepID=A7TEM7_VANPO|nr:uncharacterized protein Kpol_1036p80 [Vanderwaltozyma polyspora DSM 70294]EDO19334.1 hypothetical protein Kpol_1036p80 [Vanderwaltozyma polyspora DSM 70294]